MSNSRALSPSAQTVFDAIWDEIIFGRLSPGQRLVESDLMGRFGTYRASVREALRELVTTGLALHLPHKGVSVINLDPADIENIYAVRAEFEILAIRWIEFPVDATVLDRLEAVQRDHSAAIRQGDLRAVFRSNNEFHALMYALSGNPFLEGAIADLARKSLVVRFHPYLDDTFLSLVERDHLGMIEALKTGDRAGLEMLIRRHVPRAKDRYMKTIHAQEAALDAPAPAAEKAG